MTRVIGMIFDMAMHPLAAQLGDFPRGRFVLANFRILLRLSQTPGWIFLFQA